MKEFNNCWKDHNNEHICPIVYPIFLNTHENDICEIDILINIKPELYSCITQLISKRDLFIKLNDNNQYYFVIIQKSQFNVSCNGNYSIVCMQGTGILTVPHDCFLANNNIQIYDKQIYNIGKEYKYIVSKYTPPVEQYRKVIFKFEWKNNDKMTVLDSNFEALKQDLIYQQTQIESMQKKIKTSQGTEYESFNFEFILYILSGIITIIITIVTTYLKFKKMKKRSTVVNINLQNQTNENIAQGHENPMDITI